MKKMTLPICIFIVLLVSAVTCSSGNKAEKNEVQLSDEYYTNMFDYANSDTLLGRGINMGNFLDAPTEGAWSSGRLIQRNDFTIIKKAKFASVRIPVRWSAHTGEDQPYTIDSAFTQRVIDVVNWATNAGLRVVLNVHHYEEMMNEPSNRKEYHIARLNAMWDQISTHFPLSRYPADTLVFELLNEPNGTIGYDDWNEIIALLTETIWNDNAATQNTGSQQRKIMVGTANWGGPEGLKRLVLPDSCTPKNTIMTIHYYKPFHFTHQGAEWTDGAKAWIGTRWLGTESDKKTLTEVYDRITSWNSKPGRGFEIYVGEFGAYTKYVEQADQQAWTAFIAREAEKRKMSWAYWEFCAGFGAYDPHRKMWIDHLLDALIPKEDRL